MTEKSNIIDFDEARDKARSIIDYLSKIVIGKEVLLKHIVATILAGGHVLIEGPPGTAKTLIASGLAKTIGGVFKRVQGNPDILPTDITGYHIYMLDGTSRFVKGPVFTNILMFDELNRTPTRSQSALLQAMAEYQVTIDGITYDLPRPFHVIATEVPVEEEVGVYPLTLTLRDRFWIKCKSTYNDPREELTIVEKADILYNILDLKFDKIMEIQEFVKLQEFISKGIYVDKRIVKYIVDLVSSIRSNELVQLGPSHRGAIYLYRVSKALALINGRDYVIPDDVKELAVPVIAHRIVLSSDAEAEGRRPEDIVEETLQRISVPKE